MVEYVGRQSCFSTWVREHAGTLGTWPSPCDSAAPHPRLHWFHTVTTRSG